MEFMLYPILLAYIIISTYEAGVNGFWNLFFTAFIENLFWNFGDFSCWIGGFVPNILTDLRCLGQNIMNCGRRDFIW